MEGKTNGLQIVGFVVSLVAIAGSMRWHIPIRS